MIDVLHLTREQLEAGLDHIRESPADNGILEMIVRRPAVDEREELEVGELNHQEGLAGDGWKALARAEQPEGELNPDTQLTLMNSRMVALAAQEKSRWALAGDQLYVDMDLGVNNMPPGTRLSIGSAILEVTEELHTGCRKFVARFGAEAMKFVNSEAGRALRLRGMYARVVKPGTIRRGDVIMKAELEI